MPADAASRQLRAERVEEAAAMLRSGVRPSLVRKKLRDKYDVSPRAIEYWVSDAMRLEAPRVARNLNTLRYADENELLYASRMALDAARKAADQREYIGVAANLRSYAALKALRHKMWHIDKISPLHGLEQSEQRALIVEALRDGAHLLTEEQRQELREALAESETDADSLTTTLEAGR